MSRAAARAQFRSQATVTVEPCRPSAARWCHQCLNALPSRDACALEAGGSARARCFRSPQDLASVKSSGRPTPAPLERNVVPPHRGSTESRPTRVRCSRTVITHGRATLRGAAPRQAHVPPPDVAPQHVAARRSLALPGVPSILDTQAQVTRRRRVRRTHGHAGASRNIG